MADSKFDAIVLGGGPGGYVCAIRLAQLGLKTACVEVERVGGICLNWGCIPSKALISNAHVYVKSRHVDHQGLTFGHAALQVSRMHAWKDGIVQKLTNGIRALFKSNGVTLFEGRGVLTSSRHLTVTAKDGTETKLEASRAIVVATGSSTIEVPGFEFDGVKVVGAREAVSLREVPDRLVVIGGGVIGLELGMAYQAFGTDLTVVELTNGILPGIDPEAVRVVEKSIASRNGDIYKGTRAEGYTKKDDGSLLVKLANSNGTRTVECDYILVAVGMRPQSRDIGLEAIGVQIDERGFVRTDVKCATNVPGIYAIGDVSGQPMLAHKASKEGEVCAEVIAGRAAAKDWVAIPGVVFTDPEIAAAGLTEDKAKEKGIEVTIGKFPFSVLGRALAISETEGFVKIVADKKTTRVLGVTIVGPNASDLISEAMLALEMGASAEDLALTMHPHPTLGEAMMEAAASAVGHAIHVPNRN